jgi:hypothetical protein
MTEQLKVKRTTEWKETYHIKESELAILVSEKRGFRTKRIVKDKKDQN